MAWRVDTGEENDSPESIEENVTSSTHHINETRNINAQGAAGHTPSDGRRHSAVLQYQQNLLDMRDLRLSNAFVNRIRIGRRCSAGDINLNNAQRASGSNEVDISQRHSVPCCHINPNVLHSCCLRLNRRLSLENMNLPRRNSFPQNCTNGYGVSAGYERQHSFSITHSFLFGNENFRADGYVQQNASAGAPEFFMRFLADEMDRRGLQLPDDMCRDLAQVDMPPSFIFLMDRFSVSLERDRVYHLAMRAQFPVNLSSFITIVDGMNNGTTSPERIVVVFFFCADLAIRAFHDGNASLFCEIVLWTQWYLRGSDSLVVVPSKRSTYKITVTACIVGVITVLLLMKRN